MKPARGSCILRPPPLSSPTVRMTRGAAAESLLPSLSLPWVCHWATWVGDTTRQADGFSLFAHLSGVPEGQGGLEWKLRAWAVSM